MVQYREEVAMKTVIVFVLASLVVGCGQRLPSERDVRTHLEKRYAKELANGSLKLIDVRKMDGKRLEIFGTQIYELSYAETLEWPRGRKCDFASAFAGCINRAPGEQATQEGQITFTKSEKGWKIR